MIGSRVYPAGEPRTGEWVLMHTTATGLRGQKEVAAFHYYPDEATANEVARLRAVGTPEAYAAIREIHGRLGAR